jgi:phospholipid/cholesterol/gamma-HCH transport system substrate-binding protein
VRTAIRKHLRDFFAIVGLVVIAAFVGGYVLAHERLPLPGWVPIFGRSYFTLKGEFATAQSVTPGQGQTVDIAGVQVGDISNVDLVGGRAIVTMHVKKRYDRIYPNAHLLLRPKTGLKDMVVELDPGTPSGGRPVKSGYTIPVANTLPDVNLDEILSVLDGDTRNYLQLLLNGAATGLKGQGPQLAQVLRRLDPTATYAARITKLLAQRRANIRRAIHNFGTFALALAARDQQLGTFVDSSNAVFQRFANQSANLQRTLALLPSTLQVTNTALAHTKTFAASAGPALEALRPTARALGPALREVRPFLRESTPIIRSEIRPFTRAALPVVKTLRPAASNLAAATPDLTTTFGVLNAFLNALAYNPPGKAEGYLFYLAWLNHISNSIFSAQDAEGPIRHGLVVETCSAIAGLVGDNGMGGIKSETAGQLAALYSGVALLTQLSNTPSYTPANPGPYCTPQQLSSAP